MKRLHRIAPAVLGLAVALTVAAPTPSTADDSLLYPPSGSCTAAPATTAPGGTVDFSCADGTFDADEAVTITVTGTNGAASRIGLLHFAITTASGSARSQQDGSLAAVPITLPSDATGTYNIAAVSANSAGGTATVTITDASGLPVTGLDPASLTALWIGGGVLLLAGAALAVVAVIRRRRP